MIYLLVGIILGLGVGMLVWETKTMRHNSRRIEKAKRG